MSHHRIGAILRKSVSPIATDRVRPFSATSSAQFWDKLWKGDGDGKSGGQEPGSSTHSVEQKASTNTSSSSTSVASNAYRKLPPTRLSMQFKTGAAAAPPRVVKPNPGLTQRIPAKRVGAPTPRVVGAAAPFQSKERAVPNAKLGRTYPVQRSRPMFRLQPESAVPLSKVVSQASKVALENADAAGDADASVESTPPLANAGAEKSANLTPESTLGWEKISPTEAKVSAQTEPSGLAGEIKKETKSEIKDETKNETKGESTNRQNLPQDAPGSRRRSPFVIVRPLPSVAPPDSAASATSATSSSAEASAETAADSNWHWGRLKTFLFGEDAEKTTPASTMSAKAQPLNPAAAVGKAVEFKSFSTTIRDKEGTAASPVARGVYTDAAAKAKTVKEYPFGKELRDSGFREPLKEAEEGAAVAAPPARRDPAEEASSYHFDGAMTPEEEAVDLNAIVGKIRKEIKMDDAVATEAPKDPAASYSFDGAMTPEEEAIDLSAFVRKKDAVISEAPVDIASVAAMGVAAASASKEAAALDYDELWIQAAMKREVNRVASVGGAARKIGGVSGEIAEEAPVTSSMEPEVDAGLGEPPEGSIPESVFKERIAGPIDIAESGGGLILEAEPDFVPPEAEEESLKVEFAVTSPADEAEAMIPIVIGVIDKGPVADAASEAVSDTVAKSDVDGSEAPPDRATEKSAVPETEPSVVVTAEKTAERAVKEANSCANNVAEAAFEAAPADEDHSEKAEIRIGAFDAANIASASGFAKEDISKDTTKSATAASAAEETSNTETVATSVVLDDDDEDDSNSANLAAKSASTASAAESSGSSSAEVAASAQASSAKLSAADNWEILLGTVSTKRKTGDVDEETATTEMTTTEMTTMTTTDYLKKNSWESKSDLNNDRHEAAITAAAALAATAEAAAKTSDPPFEKPAAAEADSSTAPSSAKKKSAFEALKDFFFSR